MTPDETTRIFKILSRIEAVILGTLENPGGMAAKVDNHETWINKQRRGREGLFNYAYKTGIVIVLGYIAVKLGITH